MTLATQQIEPHSLRFDFDEYIDLAARGMFERRRVMLVDGEIVEIPPQGPDHVIAQIKVNYTLLDIFDRSKFTIQLAGPYRLDERNDPEPDILVRHGALNVQIGIADDCALVVEISDTTLAYDRRQKLPRYARGGVAEVWILNCVDKQLEVYRNPHEVSGNAFAYDPAIVLKAGDVVSPLAASGQQAAVAEMRP